MMKRCPTIDEAISAAQAVLADRYTHAVCAFVTGSTIHGRGGKFSDIDLVVVFDRVDHAWRESFVELGQPFEVFVHDRETLACFISKDVENGYPVMLDMIRSGRAIGRDNKAASRLQQTARQIFDAGPDIAGSGKLASLLYCVTTLFDDLRGSPPPAEIRAVVCQLHQPLGDLVLLGRGRWSGKGKWLPRLLESLDPDLGERFDIAFTRAIGGDCSALLALTEDELSRHGGRLFDGYRVDAAPDLRHIG